MFTYISSQISSKYDEFLGVQLGVIHSIQSNLDMLEPIFEFVSEELSPNIIISYVCPLLGLYNLDLMVQLMVALGTVFLSTDILKWMIHDDRPFWWCREKDVTAILQHRLSCETTSGVPSGHSAAIVGLAFVLFGYVGSAYKNMTYSLLMACCFAMFASRMYFGCHFLHQCLIGGLVAYGGVKFVLKPDTWLFILEAGKRFHTIVLVALGSITVLTYFLMKYFNIDPHWSVRMAFKWCEDPMHLSHVNSPVYSLFRDFGLMMGVALSAPLIKITTIELNPYISIPLTLIILIINTIAKMYTPMQSGRFAFVCYGFMRNLAFTYILLTVMPKLAIKHDIPALKKTL